MHVTELVIFRYSKVYCIGVFCYVTCKEGAKSIFRRLTSRLISCFSMVLPLALYYKVVK